MKNQFRLLLFVGLIAVISSCKKPCYVVTCEDETTQLSFEHCKVCPSGICPENFMLHEEECVDIRNNIQHCGQIGNACPQGFNCVDGRCIMNCPVTTSTVCFGSCRDLQTDANHCGECGKKCAPGQICIDGVCICPPNQSFYNGKCVNTLTDRNHCGQVGNSCPDGSICVNGRCIPNCPKATPDVCFGGCYDLQTDVKHCGTCNIQCKTGQLCVNGQCKDID